MSITVVFFIPYLVANVEYRVSGTLYNADIITGATFWIGVWQGITDEMIDYMLAMFDEFMKGRNKR